jgi:hypothetical protein
LKPKLFAFDFQPILVPVIGDSFTILTGSAVSGQFATVRDYASIPSEHFQVKCSSSTVTLTRGSVP